MSYYKAIIGKHESSDDEGALGRYGFMSTGQYLDDVEQIMDVFVKRLNKKAVSTTCNLQ